MSKTNRNTTPEILKNQEGNSFPPKLNKNQAKEYLRIFSRQNRPFVIRWAYDVQGLTFNEIAIELGYRSDSYVIDLYHGKQTIKAPKRKGGDNK